MRDGKGLLVSAEAVIARLTSGATQERVCRDYPTQSMREIENDPRKAGMDAGLRVLTERAAAGWLIVRRAGEATDRRVRRAMDVPPDM